MPNIDAKALRSWQVADRNFTLIDTLPPAAYTRAHLPGAIHIMSDDILDSAPDILPDKAQSIVVYCASETCKRAGLSVGRLESLGYTNVYHFVGGKREWRDMGYPLETATP